jgi:hypothetical protein
MNNAYHIFQEIRDNVNEAEAAHWSDKEILRKMIRAHRKVVGMMSQSQGDWLLTSTTLTPVASLITLPSDLSKPVYLEEVSSGWEIPIQGTVRNRRMTRIPGTTLEGTLGLDAYLLKDYIEVNQDGYTNQVRLWYDKRIADPHFGTADTGTTTDSLVFDDDLNPRKSDDYYNGLSLEIVSGTGKGTIAEITDYDGGTWTATVSGSFSTSSIYGTVMQVPEESLEFLIWEATMNLIAKPSSTLSEVVFQYMKSQWREAKRDFDDWLSTRLRNRIGVEATEID